MAVPIKLFYAFLCWRTNKKKTTESFGFPWFFIFQRKIVGDSELFIKMTGDFFDFRDKLKKDSNDEGESRMENAVYIFLTKSGSPLARLVRKVLPGQWSHACLSLYEDLTQMYSFGARRLLNPFVTGFKRESVFAGVYPKQRSMEVSILRVPVAAEQLLRIRDKIVWFEERVDQMKFNAKGMLLSARQQGIEIENRFFCSEFVYYVLRECGVVDFGVPRNLVTPNFLLKIPGSCAVYHGELGALQDRIVVRGSAVSTDILLGQ